MARRRVSIVPMENSVGLASPQFLSTPYRRLVLWSRGRGFPKSSQGIGCFVQGAIGLRRGRVRGGCDFLLASINRSVGLSIRRLFSAKFAECSLVNLL